MFWRKLFGFGVIYSRNTFAGVLLPAITLLVFLVILFTFSFVSRYSFLLNDTLSAPASTIIEVALPLLIVASLLSSLGWFISNIVMNIRVRRLLKSRRYLTADPTRPIKIDKAVVNEELDKVDDVRMIAEGQGWRLYDIVFNVMRRTKRGQYKAAEAYYTVFEADLKKQVPHMLFDSLSAKKRQFRNIYSKAQKLSPGPTFETAFETYVPNHYQVDALSVITPEVMEAMLAVKDYDIELLDDRLLCYAPLLMEKDLNGFRRQCLDLQRHLNDNLRAYKDDRLRAGCKGEVADFGRQLMKNPFRSLTTAIVAGLILVALLIISIVTGEPEVIFSRMSLLVFLVLVSAVADIAVLKRKNKRKEAIFLTTQAKVAELRPKS